MSNFLCDYNNVTLNNMIICIEKALNITLEDYNIMQQNCYNEYQIFAEDKVDIKKIMI